MKQRPDYGSNIPKARDMLMEIAVMLREVHGLDDVAVEIMAVVTAHLHRTPAVRKMPITSLPVDAGVVAGVRWYLKNTDKPTQWIADHYRINPGRVSEIAQGLRNSNGAVK